MKNLTPMSAVDALYATERPELAEAIVASLSQAIFHAEEAKPAGKGKVFMGRVSQKVVRWTTRSSTLPSTAQRSEPPAVNPWTGLPGNMWGCPTLLN